jgi:hypothetical protein
MSSYRLGVVAILFLMLAGSAASGALVTVDADAFPAGTVLNNAFPGVTLSALGDPGVLSNANVFSMTDAQATTGSRVFGDTSISPTLWGNGSFSYLRADFASGASLVSLDFAANDPSDNNPYLKAYNSANVLVASASAGLVSLGSPVTLTVSAPNIAYILASWDDLRRIDNGVLDNLKYDASPIPEPISLLIWGACGLAAVGCVRCSRLRP